MTTGPEGGTGLTSLVKESGYLVARIGFFSDNRGFPEDYPD